LKFRVHYHLHAAGGRLWPTWSEVEADDAIHAVAVAESRQRARDRERGRAYVGYFRDVGVEELESVNPATVPEKGEPMEASGSTTAANTTNGDAPAAEKEKREPTHYHVLKKVANANNESGPTYERLTKTAIGASSTTQAIELALADGEGNGTYVAVPERSFQEKTVKVEEVKTQKVVVG
jgi:hypothetical protein